MKEEETQISHSDRAVFCVSRNLLLSCCATIRKIKLDQNVGQCPTWWPPCGIQVTPNTGVPCSNTAKMRNPLKFAGVPQTTGSISAASGPKFTVLWGLMGKILLLSKFFFRLSIYALTAKIQPNKVVGWCPDGDFLAIFCMLYFQRPARSTFQNCILKLHYGHTMCGSMVDIQSATAVIRRGKEDRKKKKPQGKNIMSASAMQGGHNMHLAY